MSAPVTGYTVKGGTRERLTGFECPCQGCGSIIELWRTGARLAVEETRAGALIHVDARDGNGAILTTEPRARDRFEELVKEHAGVCL